MEDLLANPKLESIRLAAPKRVSERRRLFLLIPSLHLFINVFHRLRLSSLFFGL